MNMRFFLLFFLAAILSVSASARVWYVNVAAGPSGDGGSANPFNTIQRGLDVAVGGDVVSVAGGVYAGAGNVNLDFRGKAVALQSSQGRDQTAIDCRGTGRAFHLHSGETTRSVVRGFRITGANTGVVSVTVSPDQTKVTTRFGAEGSAIYCENNSGLSLMDCIVENSQAITVETFTPGPPAVIFDDDGNGGAIFCAGGGLYCNNVVVRGNRAGMNGGGICLVGGARALLVNSVIQNNVSGISQTNSTHTENTPDYTMTQFNLGAPGSGGGIYAADASLEMRGCVISGNTSGQHGGGIGADAARALKLTRCTITQNKLTDTLAPAGGGLWAATCAADLQDCTVTANNCAQLNKLVTVAQSYPTYTLTQVVDAIPGMGGGICLRDATAPRLSRCTFGVNIAGAGGALACSGVAALDIAGSTFQANAAIGAGGGGAVWMENSGASMSGDSFVANLAMGFENSMVTITTAYPGFSLTEQIVTIAGTGGALCLNASTATMKRVVWKDNTAGDEGGAVALLAHSLAIVRDFSATGNRASGENMNVQAVITSDATRQEIKSFSSGGLNGGGFLVDDSSLIQQRGTIAKTASGGAILLRNFSTANIEDVLILANVNATTVNATNNYALPSGALISSSVTTNTTGTGVGLYLESSRASLKRDTILRNFGDAGSDGVYAAAGSELGIASCIIWGNALASDTSSVVTVTSSLIQGSHARDAAEPLPPAVFSRPAPAPAAAPQFQINRRHFPNP